MHLVMSRDGTILGTGGDAPSTWVGSRLDEIVDAPDDLKAAAHALLAPDRQAPLAVSSFPLDSLSGHVHLTLVDALPLRRQPVDLRALLPSVLEALRCQAAAADVTLKVTVDANIPAQMLIDPAKIAWAVTVLVGNALRYVRHGSRLMPGGTIAVCATCDRADRAVVIEVCDDGAGIPQDTMTRLFADALNQPRMALGLSMVREVVTAHGGRIDVDSRTERGRSGTTVRVLLPAC